MNIENIYQRDPSNRLFDSSNVMSLEQIMADQVVAMGKTASTGNGDDGVDILPVPDDGAETKPISNEEQFFLEFSKTVLDGTPRTKEEISVLLKEMAKKYGIPEYDLQTKKFAMIAAVQEFDKKGDQNADVRKLLMGEFHSLRYVEKMHKKLLERIIAPTVQNGGLDFYGNDRRDLFKD